MKNKAAYMTQLDKIEIRDIPVPSPKPEEVLIQRYVGICGRTSIISMMALRDYVWWTESFAGHECAGVVADIGTNVRLRSGIMLRGQELHAACDSVRAENTILPRRAVSRFASRSGCFAKYITFPENMCFVF